MFLLTCLTALPVLGLKTKDHMQNEKSDTTNKNKDNSLNIQRGDIVFRYVDENVMPFWSFLMHPAIFTGEVIKDGSSSGDLYKFIEARGDPDPEKCVVKYTYYTEHGIFYLNELCYTACRVNCSPEQVENAVDFMEWRKGDELLGVWKKPLKEYNPTIDNTWYCTEVIWAAYMNCDNKPGSDIYGRGIDIGGIGQVITSSDFLNSPNVEQISLFSNPQQSPGKSMVKQINPLFNNIIMRLLDSHPNMFSIIRTVL
jgi:hypothetical protein